jgi:hypothetical protein
MQRMRENMEWFEMTHKNFLVVEVKGFVIKIFVTGLGMAFLQKVVTDKDLKSDMETYEKFQLLRPGLSTVPLPI